MSKKYKVGWQKYEDLLDDQISNPLYISIMTNMMQMIQNNLPAEEELDEHEYQEESGGLENIQFPISKQLIDDINMLSNFDCWIGHTNFDITNDTKNKLNSVPGVEVLKICSRYRFFVGIAKMFDFKEVRKNIESSIIP